LEYILVLSAIVAAVVAATGKNGVVTKAVDKMFSEAGGTIEDASTNFRKNVGGN
jgi:phage-related minor tail protein